MENLKLCKYKNLFGEEKTGAHSYRIFNIAIVDVILTVIGAYVLSVLLKTNFWYTQLFAFATGILMHRIFCVKTTIDKLLFK
jgi:hypothetical protein